MLIWVLAYSVILTTVLSPFIFHQVKSKWMRKLIESEGIKIQEDILHPTYHPVKMARLKVRTIFGLVIVAPLITSFLANTLSLTSSSYIILFHVIAWTLIFLGIESYFQFRKDIQERKPERIFYRQIVPKQFEVYLTVMKKKGRRDIISHRLFNKNSYVDYGTVEYALFSSLQKEIREWTILHLMDKNDEVLELIKEMEGKKPEHSDIVKHKKEQLLLLEKRIDNLFEKLRHPSPEKVNDVAQNEREFLNFTSLDNETTLERPELVELKKMLRKDLPEELRESIQLTIIEIEQNQLNEQKERRKQADISEAEAVVKTARMLNGLDDLENKKGE